MTWRGRWWVWLVAVAAGCAQAFAYRWTSNPDGISYIDIAREWMERPSIDAVSTYWSPLYSWLLALTFRLMRADAMHWFIVAHVVNVICFIAVLGASLTLLRRTRAGYREEPLARAATIAAATFACLVSIDLQLVTPDLLLCALSVYGAGAALDLLAEPLRTRHALKFGVVLGVAYLAKAIALYIFGITIVALCAAGALQRRSFLKPAMVAFGAWLLVAAPWIVAQSVQTGAFTTGSAGKVAYPQEVLGKPRLGALMPRDSLRPGAAVARGATLVSVTPWMVRIDSTLPGASPAQYDVSRWHEHDRRLAFDAQLQWRTLMAQVLGSWPTFAIAIALLAALFVSGSVRSGRDLSALIVSCAPLFVVGGMYLLILVEPRYLAPLWLPVAIIVPSMFGAAADEHAQTRPAWHPLLIALTVACTAGVTPAVLRSVTYLVTEWRTDDDAPESVRPALEFLQRAGVTPGESVAVLGDPFEVEWATILNLRVSVISPSTRNGAGFLTLPAAERAALLQQLREARVTHLILRGPLTSAVMGVRIDADGEWAVVRVQ